MLVTLERHALVAHPLYPIPHKVVNAYILDRDQTAVTRGNKLPLCDALNLRSVHYGKETSFGGADGFADGAASW